MAYALGAVKRHVYRAANEVGPRFGIAVILGVGARADPTSDHPKGLALDFMTRTAGTALAAFMQANAHYYGVKYIIWQQHIWSVDRSSEGWRQMEDRGGDTANHFDHVHVSFLTPTQFSQVIGKDDPIAPGPIDPVPPNDPRLPPGIRPPGWDTLSGVTDALQKIGVAARWLTDTHNWLRVGMFILGALLILLGLVSLGLKGVSNA